MTDARARVLAVLVLLCVLLWVASRRERFERPAMPMYVINLKRRPDRLHACMAALKDWQATVRASDRSDITVIEAVDGKTLETGKAKLTRGEVGCFLSHLAVLDEIAQGEAPWGLVLEDDGRLDVPRKDMASLVREIPRGVDVVALGCNAFPGPPQTRHVSDRFHEFIGYDLYGTHAMMYSRRGARALLRVARHRGFDVPYDVWLARQKAARLVVAHPPLARAAADSDSDTQKTR
jgi:glycosyl transferase family 25